MFPWSLKFGIWSFWRSQRLPSTLRFANPFIGARHPQRPTLTTMKIRWIRLVLGPIAAEVLAILILICLVAIFGPRDQAQAQAYAEKLGAWVGPLAGVVLSFLGALWVSRGLTTGHLLHGFLFGLIYATLDAAIIIAAQAPFAWLFVASDAGKLLAGIAGGLVAAAKSKNLAASI